MALCFGRAGRDLLYKDPSADSWALCGLFFNWRATLFLEDTRLECSSFKKYVYLIILACGTELKGCREAQRDKQAPTPRSCGPPLPSREAAPVTSVCLHHRPCVSEHPHTFLLLFPLNAEAACAPRRRVPGVPVTRRLWRQDQSRLFLKAVRWAGALACGRSVADSVLSLSGSRLLL